MKITGVIVISSKEHKKYKVEFTDDQLLELSECIEEPTDRGMVDYFSNDNVEALVTSKKYYISGNNDTESYQLEIMKHLMPDSKNISGLATAKDLYNNGNLIYDLVGYITEKDNGNQEILIYKLKKINLVKDRGFWIFKKKAGSTHNNDVKVVQIENGFNLPFDSCLVSLYRRNNDSEGNIYKLKVYNAYDFDEVFNTKETQYKYVDRNLKKFVNEITLTTDKLRVSFAKADMEDVKEFIYQDDNLTKSFASFRDNKHRKIKQITIEQLEGVLKTLQEYVKNNADAGFVLDNIPKINDKRELEVTKDSIPTLAALLDNTVIQRLLDNKIEIPYYKRRH